MNCGYWPYMFGCILWGSYTCECVVNSSMGLFGSCITQTVSRSKTSCWGLNESHLVKFISTFIISTLCTASFHGTRSPMCLADISVYDWPHIATCLTTVDIRQVTDNKCTGKLIYQQYYTHLGKVCELCVLQPRPQYINFINLLFRFIILFIHEVTSVFLSVTNYRKSSIQVYNTVYPWGDQCVFIILFIHEVTRVFLSVTNTVNLPFSFIILFIHEVKQYMDYISI